MGTQKNRLNETVLLSTQNILKLMRKKNIYNFTLKKFVYLNLCKTLLEAKETYHLAIVRQMKKTGPFYYELDTRGHNKGVVD